MKITSTVFCFDLMFIPFSKSLHRQTEMVKNGEADPEGLKERLLEDFETDIRALA